MSYGDRPQNIIHTRPPALAHIFALQDGRVNHCRRYFSIGQRILIILANNDTFIRLTEMLRNYSYSCCTFRTYYYCY